MDYGPLRAGQFNGRGGGPRRFQDEMLHRQALWSGDQLEYPVRVAITRAFATQAIPWFVAFEDFRAHVSDYCRRNARTVERNHGSAAALLREVQDAIRGLQAEVVGLRGRLDTLSSRLDALAFSSQRPCREADRDDEELDIRERVARAQRRARSYSPAAQRLQPYFAVEAAAPDTAVQQQPLQQQQQVQQCVQQQQQLCNGSSSCAAAAAGVQQQQQSLQQLQQQPQHQQVFPQPQPLQQQLPQQLQ